MDNNVLIAGLLGDTLPCA